MLTKPVNMRVDEPTLNLLINLAAQFSVSRAEILRRALRLWQSLAPIKAENAQFFMRHPKTGEEKSIILIDF